MPTRKRLEAASLCSRYGCLHRLINLKIDMQKNVLVMISVASVLAAKIAFPQTEAIHRTQQEQLKEKELEQGQKKYTCPMHPEVVMDHPGNCPKCGMKLIPLKSKRPTACPERKPNGSNAQAPTPNAEHSSHEMHDEHAMHAMPQSDQHAMSMQSSASPV